MINDRVFQEGDVSPETVTKSLEHEGNHLNLFRQGGKS